MVEPAAAAVVELVVAVVVFAVEATTPVVASGLTSVDLDVPNRPDPLDKPLKLGRVADVVGLVSVLVKFVLDADAPKPVVVPIFDVAEFKLPPKLILLPNPVVVDAVAGLEPPKLKPPKPVETDAAGAVAVVADVVVAVAELVDPKLNPPNPVEAGVVDAFVSPNLKPVLEAGAVLFVVVVVEEADVVVDVPKAEVVDDEPNPPNPVLAG